MRTCFHPFKSTWRPTSKNPNYSVWGWKTLPESLQTTSWLIPSHSWPSHPTLQAYHSEISKPSSVLCTGSTLCLQYLHSTLIPHPVRCLAHTPHPQAESISPSFVPPSFTSQPVNTLDIAITTCASIFPTKLRAACKQTPHLIPI